MANLACALSSDEALVGQMAQSENEALRELCMRYGTVLFLFAVQVLEDETQAYQVAADTFWTAMQQASRYDASKQSVALWLTEICGNLTARGLLAADRARNPAGLRAQGKAAPAEPLLRRLLMFRAGRREKHQRVALAALTQPPQTEIAGRLGLEPSGKGSGSTTVLRPQRTASATD